MSNYARGAAIIATDLLRRVTARVSPASSESSSPPVGEPSSCGLASTSTENTAVPKFPDQNRKAESAAESKSAVKPDDSEAWRFYLPPNLT